MVSPASMSFQNIPKPRKPSTGSRRQAKIVATLGPSVFGIDNLRQLVDAGMDVARINTAHGTLEQRAELINDLRTIEEETGKHIPILMDLRGLKLRTGPLAGDDAVPLARGSQLRLYPGPVETKDGQVGINYDRLLEVLVPGERVLLADGLIELLVESVGDECAVCSVGRGGPLASGQGATLPNVRLQDAAITDADRRDIAFAAEHGIEFIGLSFLSTDEDVYDARRIALSYGAQPGIVAKIERPYALGQIEPIARAADAVMVARGDLGVQLPPEQVPRAQKEIVRVCNRLGTPVITATQMLESMIMQPVPTRAETSDVANAIFDGSDAVMLSAETATGRFPFEAVQMMERIIRETEKEGAVRPPGIAEADPTENAENAVTAALGRATRSLIDAAAVQAVVVFTLSGASARLVSRNRPNAPILAITTDPYVARRLGLLWGVRAHVLPLVDDLNELIELASDLLVSIGELEPGLDALFVGSLPVFRVSGRTNLVHVRAIEPLRETES
ncbi:MAG: pyruvate kinase [Thermomicrobiales bacterium]